MTPELLQLIASAVTIPDVSSGNLLSREQLLTATDLPSLAPPHPGKDNNSLLEQINSIEISIQLRAGLLLIHDFLEESHQLSQSIEGNINGDYWHAIMHRREPDYSNAMYWFRRVGEHPVFNQLYEVASEIIQSENSHHLLAKGTWDPFAFVDFCEMCTENPNNTNTNIARHIQWTEIILLMEYCYDV